jgi:hypothetical protein
VLFWTRYFAPECPGWFPGWVAPITFRPVEIEMMGKLEHKRRMREKISSCWTFGHRDASEKTHSCLVEWEELPGNEKEKNRDVGDILPVVLASINYEIVRNIEQ